MLSIIINQILKMLILLIVGIFCYRIKLIDEKANQALADILLLIVNPCVALNAFQVDYDPRLSRGLLISFGLSLLAHLIGISISQLAIPKKENENFAIERFSAMYANCGFIGIPLVRSLLGNDGVFYLTAYITVFNLLSWTHGIILMTGKTDIRNLKKGLLSPMVVACLTGLVTYLIHFRFPEVLGDSIRYIADMNTPLAMLIAGLCVAKSNPLAMLTKVKYYYITFLKLLVIPAIVLVILAILHLDQTLSYTILVCSACPIAATCTAFSLRFQKNYQYASELYAFSTICSLVTIPVIIFAAEHLLC